MNTSDSDSNATPESSKAQPDSQPVSPKEESVESQGDEKPASEDAKSSAVPQIDISPEEHKSYQREELLNRYGLIGLLAAICLAVIPIFRLFLVPVILAASFSTLFYPLYLWILRKLGGRKGLSSLACCLVLLLGMLIPSYVLIHVVAKQTIQMYSTANVTVRQIIKAGDDGFIGEVKRSRPVQLLRVDKIDVQALVQEAGKFVGRFGTVVINRTSEGLMSLFANVAIMLFTMFYFFIDGEQIVKRIGYLSPLRHGYEKMLLSRFALISRATIKGTILIGLTQGVLGSITLLIGGVDTWLLWGFVMVILSIIPVVGAWLILIPAAIIQMILGNVFQGIFILVISTVVISNVDNLLRPRLVGRDAKMHDLLIFFSTLGGIAVFGIMGFIIGPVIVSLFVAVLDIYESEFRDQLTSLEEQ